MTNQYPKIRIETEPDLIFSEDMLSILNACLSHYCGDFSVESWEITDGRYLWDNEDGTWSIVEWDGEEAFILASGPNVNLWRALCVCWQRAHGMETLYCMVHNYLDNCATEGSRNGGGIDILDATLAFYA